MNRGDNEGPKTYEPRVERQTICNGCKYLYQTAGLRSRTEHRDNYSCTHPDIMKEEKGMSFMGMKGRVIHYNEPYPCHTPHWCPFLKPKMDNKDYCICPDFGFYELGGKKICSRCNREKPPHYSNTETK